MWFSNLFRRIKDFANNSYYNSCQYNVDSEAVIVSCFYNPTNSPYRLIAFNKFYQSIKHMNHYIIECSIGDSPFQLPDNIVSERVSTNSCLWHKEALLNKAIKNLPNKYKYVFWIDADVIFTNMKWLTESVDQMRNEDVNIVQPFEFCVHLNKDEFVPNFDLQSYKSWLSAEVLRHPQLWRSFCANYVTTNLSANENYDKHGHVGFAWGMKREILDKLPLFDKALIGGADHIIAHAAAGHIPHKCILKSFVENSKEIEEWSVNLYNLVQGKIGYSTGDLYHIWHGDLKKRDYLNRIRDFNNVNQSINEKDENGLYVVDGNLDDYVDNYLIYRDATSFSDSCLNSYYELAKYGYNTSLFFKSKCKSGCSCEINGYLTERIEDRIPVIYPSTIDRFFAEETDFDFPVDYVNAPEVSSDNFTNYDSSDDGSLQPEVSSDNFINYDSSDDGSLKSEVSSDNFINYDSSDDGSLQPEVSSDGFTNYDSSNDGSLQPEVSSDGFGDSTFS